MDKITEKENKIITRTHSFYCDDCGEHILDSEEYDDGYIPQPKTFRIQHVELKGHFCEKCGQKRVDDVIAYARSKGFDI